MLRIANPSLDAQLQDRLAERRADPDHRVRCIPSGRGSHCRLFPRTTFGYLSYGTARSRPSCPEARSMSNEPSQSPGQPEGCGPALTDADVAFPSRVPGTEPGIEPHELSLRSTRAGSVRVICLDYSADQVQVENVSD